MGNQFGTAAQSDNLLRKIKMIQWKS